MDDTLSIYQHPTLTVLIDDSRSFLISLVFRLSPLFVHKVFDAPQAALDWLEREHRHADKEPIRVGYDEETGSIERRSASIDVAEIYRMAMNQKRFTIPSVLVIDYAMPQMNGVEFCQAVRNLPCKKILLTGQADEKIALDAFNRKLINCFINKNDPDAPDKLEAEIIKLQGCFFKERTSTLKDLLSRHSYSFLSDPAIGVLAKQIYSRCCFVEYYLFPNPAGILFFDIQGKATLMVIETKASLMSHFEIAQDQGAPPELLNALREQRVVPFFSDTDGVYLKEIGNNWLSYCLQPHIQRGKQDYFWALFDLPGHYFPGPVYSYGKFLKDQEVLSPQDPR